MCAVRLVCWAEERVGRVQRVLKVQIWDSWCRERSEKRMVYGSDGGEVLEMVGGNVAAKRQ